MKKINPKTTKILIYVSIASVIIYLAYTFFFKNLISEHTRNTYNWLLADPIQRGIMEKKALANGVTVQQQAMADAKWYADQDKLKQP